MIRCSNTIKERLLAGKLVSTMYFTGIATPKLIEMAGAFGNFHGLWIDLEHSAHSHAQLELMLIACRAAGLDAFARVAPTDYAILMRPMEAGCSGVMIVQIRTLDQVKQAVQWVKYPPVGERGMFAATFEANYGELDLPTHIANANRDRWLSVQIETVEALNVVEQIASVEGVDWLFVGPVDLSIALGVPGDFLHPRCVDALTRVAAAVKKHDKPWGILCREPTHAKQCQALGAQLFSVAGDIECFRTGLQHIRTRFTEVFAEN